MESRYYVYLISSLPMLHLGAKPPFSFERFLAMCEGLILEKEMEALKELNLTDTDSLIAGHSTLKKWYEFDMALRNELVKIRASRRHLDPSRYLRADGYTEAHLYQAAFTAYRNPSPLEGEKALDQERWRFLEELLQGHYFDFDVLIIYGLKLLLLEKWEKIGTADNAALVEAALQI